MMADLAAEVGRVASDHVRSRTRVPAYFEGGDRFAERLLGGVLLVETEHLRTVAVDIPAALDSCYDEITEGSILDAELPNAITRALETALDPAANASALMAHLETMGRPACALLDVSRALLTASATMGCSSIANIADDAAMNTWHGLWSEQIRQHDRQQAFQGAVALVRAARPADRDRLLLNPGMQNANLRPRSVSFEEGVLEYVDVYRDTSATGIALLGSMAFSKRLRRGELGHLLELWRSDGRYIDLLNRLFRLALDVRFDPSEGWSAGTYAMAAERGVRVFDVDPRERSPSEVEGRLRREWRRFSDESRALAAELIAKSGLQGTVREVLVELAATAHVVADALAGRAPLDLPPGS